MLKKVLGSTRAELAKSLLVGVLVTMLAISLVELGAARRDTQVEEAARQVVAAISRQFATALITYDYAHLSIQLLRIGVLSSSGVIARLQSDDAQIRDAGISSVGDVNRTAVMSLGEGRAEAFAWTSAIVTRTQDSTVMRINGILDLGFEATRGQDWMVVDYRWLSSGTGPP